MKSSVSHFKVFGCVAYAHVPEELRRKLDDRSEKCVFLDTMNSLKHTGCIMLLTRN
jgi:hypothetical protein